MTMGLIGAPREFAGVLGELPDGARLSTGGRAHVGLLIWFVRRETELAAGIVRNAGLDAGLVDYKVCAIDETWSGLLFARRKSIY